MDIRITNSHEDFGCKAYKLTLQQFACNEYHPFIATNKWDKVYIDICDATPKGIIKQLIPIMSIRTRLVQQEMTVHIMQIMQEVYPDHAAELRVTFMKDKDAFEKLVKDLVDEII